MAPLPGWSWSLDWEIVYWGLKLPYIRHHVYIDDIAFNDPTRYSPRKRVGCLPVRILCHRFRKRVEVYHQRSLNKYISMWIKIRMKILYGVLTLADSTICDGSAFFQSSVFTSFWVLEECVYTDVFNSWDIVDDPNCKKNSAKKRRLHVDDIFTDALQAAIYVSLNHSALLSTWGGWFPLRMKDARIRPSLIDAIKGTPVVNLPLKDTYAPTFPLDDSLTFSLQKERKPYGNSTFIHFNAIPEWWKMDEHPYLHINGYIRLLEGSALNNMQGVKYADVSSSLTARVSFVET